MTLEWIEQSPGGWYLARGSVEDYLIAQDDRGIVLARYASEAAGPVIAARQAALTAIRLDGAYDAVPETARAIIGYLQQAAQAYESGTSSGRFTFSGIAAHPAWRRLFRSIGKIRRQHMILHISHGADPGNGREPDWFVVHPLEGQTETSVAGTPITHTMAVASLLDARRAVYAVNTETCTVVRLEPPPGTLPVPAYPDVRVTAPGPPRPDRSRELLTYIVAGALVRAGYEDQAELFTREAETRASYDSVLNAARHWVTVLTYEPGDSS